MKARDQDRVALAMRNLPLPYMTRLEHGVRGIIDVTTREEVGNVTPEERLVPPVFLYRENTGLQGYFEACGVGFDVLPEYLR